jgi:hypothetical protein
MTGALGETPVVAVYDAALDVGHVYWNPDETAFVPAGDGFADPAGTTHPAADLPLDPLHAFDAMWFAWHGFYPQSQIND